MVHEKHSMLIPTIPIRAIFSLVKTHLVHFGRSFANLSFVLEQVLWPRNACTKGEIKRDLLMALRTLLTP